MTPRSKSRILFSVLFLFVLSPLFGQQLTNIWRFGNGCGLDFSSGSPVNMPVGPMNTLEGCASACDASGQLLFYTNGVNVWNRNDVVMPNGAGLLGGSSATMILVVPKPGDCGKFYIFYVHDHFGVGNFYYSIVDMCLNNGLGDVVLASKNIFLHSPTSEKITAVKHANGTDVWIITHELASANFRVYLLTASGITLSNSTPIGSVHPSNCLIGYMKANSSGTKLVCNNTFCTKTEMFDFNNATGMLSNFQDLVTLFNIPNGAYGIEFSPNGNQLYISTCWITNYLYQIDLTTNIRTQLATMSGNYQYGALQLGPDGKIYMARNPHPFLDVINNPNVSGVACGFVAAGHTLTAGSMCQSGLPCYVPYLVTSPPDPLVFSLGNDTAICSAFTLNPPSSCGSAFLWQDNSTSPNFNVTAPGIYSVQITSFCGIGSDTIQVTVSTVNPVVSVSADTIICQTQSSLLVASGANTYNWQPGNLNGASVTVTPSATTTYTVVGTSACGSDTSYVTVVVNPMPVFQASADTIICAGQTITLNASGVSSYNWQPGNINSASIVVAPAVTTTYTVTGTSSCRIDTALIIVQVNQLPVVLTSPDTTICMGQNATLTSSGAVSYNWQPGNQNAASILVSPSVTTTYTVVGINSCGSDTSLITVNPIPIPVLQVSADSTICSGQNITLSASGVTSYYWLPGNFTSAGITVAPSTTTTYTVIGTSVCGSDTSQVTVFVNPLPALQALSDTICAGQSVTLNASGASSYNWQPGNFSTSSILVTPSVTTTYTLTGTNTCGSDSTFVTVVVDPIPVLQVSTDTTICFGETVVLNATGATAYNWQPGNFSASSITVSPATTTTYSVTATTTCPSAAAMVTVNVLPPFTLAFSYTIDNCTATGTFVSATVGIQNATWDFGDAGTGIGNPVQHTYGQAGVYTVTLEAVNLSGCTDSVSFPVTILPGSMGVPVVPNVFTPNGDNTNDVFEIGGNSGCEVYEIKIYDRWGVLLYESSDFVNNPWDGKASGGEAAVQGLYYYTLSGKTISYSGFVNLLR